MDLFRFHLTQYRTYIEKLQSLNDEQLEKLAGADQDSWSTPVELVFGKSLAQGTPTGDVFEGVQAQPLPLTGCPARIRMNIKGYRLKSAARGLFTRISAPRTICLTCRRRRFRKSRLRPDPSCNCP